MLNKKVKFLNIAITMRSRMGFMWFLTFFYQAGFILAWITTTSLFIEFFGIQNLLWLFFSEAVLVFLGSIFSHYFLQKIEISRVLLWATGIIIAMILAGFLLRNGRTNQIELLFLGIIAKDLLYPRLRTGLLRKTESLFSPLEAEKAVPMIDSALTIGVVVISGIVLTVLEIFPNLPTQDILFIWIFPLLLIGGMLLLESKIIKKVPHVYDVRDPYEKEGNSFSKIFHDLRKTPFLKFLLVVILLQSVLYTVTEFEFIRKLDSLFEENPAKISLQVSDLQTNIFAEAKEGAQEIANYAVEKLEHGASKIYAHETLLHDLTGLSLIFGLIALFVQFLLTPWVLSKFGIVRAINFYFAGFLAMTFSFVFGGYMPINFVRGFEHSFHSLFMSGYHLAFYSVVEKNREFLRHIVEGMITPLAIIIAVLIVGIFKQFSALSLLQFMIAVLAAATFLISSLLHKSRTKLATNNLRTAENISQKIRAIEVLGQSGHNNSHHVLARELKNNNHHQILREKIIETLSKIKNMETIHTYVNLLEQKTENNVLKIKILESMLAIDNLKTYSQNRHFMRFKMVNVLRELFESAKSSHLKKLIIMNIFQHLPAEEIVPFFNKVMESDDDRMQSVCLRSCSMFDDPDVVTFIEPYLNHISPRVRSHALIAIWKFSEKDYLREILYNLLSSDSHEAKVAGIYAIGEIDDYQSLGKLYQFSREENLEIRLHSLVARAKMGDEKSISGILELLFSADEKTAHKVFNMLKRGVPAKLYEKIKEEIHRTVSVKVKDIVGPYLKVGEAKNNLSASVLNYLKRLYYFTGKHDDLLVLEQYYS